MKEPAGMEPITYTVERYDQCPFHKDGLCTARKTYRLCRPPKWRNRPRRCRLYDGPILVQWATK